MIKESWNLIGQEACLTSPNQKLTSLDEYLHPKNLRYQLIPTTDIADHRIQQSDKMRGTTGQTQ